MSDPFTRDKLRWLDQLLADRGVSDGAFRLCYLLASRYINRKTLDSFCGQKRLADDLGMTLRGIRKLLDQLTTRGHLLITKPEIQGRGHVDRCRWNIKKGNASSSFNDEKRNASSSFNDRKRGTTVPKKEEPPFQKGGTTVPPTPFEESLRANPSERRRDADSDKRAGKTTTKGRSKSCSNGAAVIETDKEREVRWWGMFGNWIEKDESGWPFREWGPRPGDDDCEIPDSVAMLWLNSVDSPRASWHVKNALRVLERKYLSEAAA